MPLSFCPNLALHPPTFYPGNISGNISVCERRPRTAERSAPPNPSRWRCAQSPSDRHLPDEPVLEGDLVVFRERPADATTADSAWRIAACTGSFAESVQLCPVCARSVDDRGNWELFVEEEHLLDLAFQPLSRLQLRFIDAHYEMRVIEDRIINPHGEESEHCWRVDPAAMSNLPIAIQPPPGFSNA